MGRHGASRLCYSPATRFKAVKGQRLRETQAWDTGLGGGRAETSLTLVPGAVARERWHGRRNGIMRKKRSIDDASLHFQTHSHAIRYDVVAASMPGAHVPTGPSARPGVDVHTGPSH